MRQVWRYPLNFGPVETVVTVEMPVEARILTMQLKDGIANLWVEVPEDTSTVETRSFRIVGTGELGVQPTDEYVGTFIAGSVIGTLVFHVYEIKEQS